MADSYLSTATDEPFRLAAGPLLRGSRSRSLVFLFAVVLALLWLGSPLAVADVAENASAGRGYAGAEIWREVSRGAAGYVPGGTGEAGVLINRSGEQWRRWRLELIRPAGQWLLAGTLGLLALFYLVVGRNRLQSPATGETVERWRRRDRWLHWCMAGLFLVLAITGLSILYGKYIMLDLMGKAAFGSYLQVAKWLHNYLGPLFVVNLLLVLVCWVRNNRFSRQDLRWFAQGGGFIKGRHPHAGFMNGGEKLWFWVLMGAGSLVSVSGLMMDFPALVTLRSDLQLANLIHGGASLLLLCASFGHIYIGTLGTEGALQGMVTGRVDKSWARQHHDLWLKELERRQP